MSSERRVSHGRATNESHEHAGEENERAEGVRSSPLDISPSSRLPFDFLTQGLSLPKHAKPFQWVDCKTQPPAWNCTNYLVHGMRSVRRPEILQRHRRDHDNRTNGECSAVRFPGMTATHPSISLPETQQTGYLILRPSKVTACSACVA